MQTIGTLEPLGIGLRTENKRNSTPEIIVELPANRHVRRHGCLCRISSAQLARLAKHGGNRYSLFLDKGFRTKNRIYGRFNRLDDTGHVGLDNSLSMFLPSAAARWIKGLPSKHFLQDLLALAPQEAKRVAPRGPQAADHERLVIILARCFPLFTVGDHFKLDHGIHLFTNVETPP